MKLTESVEMPEVTCLNCGAKLDAASGVSDAGEDFLKPEPGSISVCIYCGHAAAFADDLTLRPLTDEETVDLAGDPRLVSAMKAIHKTKTIDPNLIYPGKDPDFVFPEED